MSRVVFLIAAMLALALPAVGAAGGQPTRTKVPDSQFTASVPAGAVCPFAASSAPVANNEYNLTYPAEPNGDVVVRQTGMVVVRYTNDETGKSIVVNISGPVTIVMHPDGSQTITFLGPTGLGNVIPPVPGFFIVDGRTVVDQSASGVQTLVSFNGTVKLDVCAALA